MCFLIIGPDAKGEAVSIAITKIDGKTPSYFEGKIYSKDVLHSHLIDIEASIKLVKKDVKVYWSLIDPDGRVKEFIVDITGALLIFSPSPIIID